MKRIGILLLTVLAVARNLTAKMTPNLVFILADDLGYGDVHCLNPSRGKIPTPNLDRLAAQGKAFTDAHSGASVCTPKYIADGRSTADKSQKNDIPVVLWKKGSPFGDESK